MSYKRVVNTMPEGFRTSGVLSGLFLAESGYCTGLKSNQETLQTNFDMRMYYLVSGKGTIQLANKTHIVQQHDVFFQCQNEKLNMIVNPSVPLELWWIDFYGDSVSNLKKRLGINEVSPIIYGISEPRFFQELKSIVTHYDAVSAADKLHIISGLYKLFALLLDFCNNSQWVSAFHDDPAILYTGKWIAWPSPFGDPHEEYYTAEPKAYAEYNFHGTGIKWFGTINFDCGKADVIIDGNYMTTIDTYNPVRLSKQLLYCNSKLDYGHHIIKIFCTSTKNDKATNCDVVIESFQYLSSLYKQERDGESSNGSSIMVRKATETIKANIGDMTVDRLAQLLDVNRSYLSARFSSEIGVSPSQYLMQIRMDTAKKMLAETDMPISKIAAVVGYNDVFYFSRIFRQRENVTPSQFRKLACK